MKKINNRRWLAALVMVPVLLMLLIASCKKMESPVEVVSNDTTKPDVVSNIKVENLNGGARLTYTLPNSKNLLYVLASYKINDKVTRETKSSYYRDTVIVDGFARAQEYEVTLYAVSRANIKSDPVVVKVNPKTPNYLLINDNLTITPDFGGANFFGFNPNKVPVAVHVIAFNEKRNAYDEEEPQYLTTDTVNVSVRGYDAVPKKFGVFVTDRFGNVSDTVFKTLTPLYETMLDKSKFSVYHLASDSPIGYGWELKYFFDGNTGDPGWHTLGAPTKQGTFALGTSAKLSRFVLWERLNSIFTYQNVRQMTLWGTNSDSPGDSTLPLSSAPGTVSGDWVNLGNFTYPNPPSGLPPNQANASDQAFVAAGVNFKISINAPSTKFIRFQCTQTWGGLDYVNAMEISLYGNPL
ncbi:DUF4959 domain-containing protein [Mucilaginibacter sp. CAU 1740]|uniref:DUF4959 domain-containing protein n=1 Tax=Mucilaginibacter sp. CAU 1740 TaxID=3140365 RepID=UPI00325A66E3